MSVRILVQVSNYAEMGPHGGEHLKSFQTVLVESPELERLLSMDYGNRAHATVIGAELVKVASTTRKATDAGQADADMGGDRGQAMTDPTIPPKLSPQQRKRVMLMFHAYLTYHARKIDQGQRTVQSWLYLLEWARLGGKPSEVIHG